MSKKTLACGDIMPGCAFKAEAATEQELLGLVQKHAGQAHGIKQVTPEILQKVKSAIRTV